MNTICFGCDIYRRIRSGHPRAYCAAFPDGIPDDILFEGYDHRKPHTGDGGVLFHLDPRKEKQLAVYEKLIELAK